MQYFLLLLFLLSWLGLYFLCMHCDVKFTFTRTTTTQYRAKNKKGTLQGQELRLCGHSLFSAAVVWQAGFYPSEQLFFFRGSHI